MYPTRKRNRLKNYNYGSHDTYFITICTKDKACILSKIIRSSEFEKPEIRLSPLGEIVQKHIFTADELPGITIENYVIMPNHIHLLIYLEPPVTPDNPVGEKPNERIPTLIGGLKRMVNREIGNNIFQRSYYDHIIRSQKDYDAIWDYIDGNPSEWTKDKYHPGSEDF